MFKEIPDSEIMLGRNFTYIEKQLADILYKIWENRNSVDQKDIEQLQKFALKPVTHE
jgi:hypothetical protein